MARDADQETRPVIIKKYANRRLYNTDTSTYVTLEDLAEMVRGERDFVVYDAKTGEDLTHSVLTQIIVEQESRGTNLLPIGFLRQLIRFRQHRCRSSCRATSNSASIRSPASRSNIGGVSPTPSAPPPSKRCRSRCARISRHSKRRRPVHSLCQRRQRGDECAWRGGCTTCRDAGSLGQVRRRDRHTQGRTLCHAAAARAALPPLVFFHTPFVIARLDRAMPYSRFRGE